MEDYLFACARVSALENGTDIDVETVTELLYRLFSGKMPLID